LERVGIPTVVASCLFTVASRTGANRIVRAGHFHHPFGDPERTPEGEFQWRRHVVEVALKALTTPVQQPTVFDVQEYVLR
jgi:glycine/betaine/sarcosine/D-proline reductase family selenoprotein B